MDEREVTEAASMSLPQFSLSDMVWGKRKDEVKAKHKHELTSLLPGPGDERESRVGRIDW